MREGRPGTRTIGRCCPFAANLEAKSGQSTPSLAAARRSLRRRDATIQDDASDAEPIAVIATNTTLVHFARRCRRRKSRPCDDQAIAHRRLVVLVGSITKPESFLSPSVPGVPRAGPGAAVAFGAERRATSSARDLTSPCADRTQPRMQSNGRP